MLDRKERIFQVTKKEEKIFSWAFFMIRPPLKSHSSMKAYKHENKSWYMCESTMKEHKSKNVWKTAMIRILLMLCVLETYIKKSKDDEKCDYCLMMHNMKWFSIFSSSRNESALSMLNRYDDEYFDDTIINIIYEY